MLASSRHPVAVRQLRDGLVQHGPLSERSVVVTVDDGFAGTLRRRLDGRPGDGLDRLVAPMNCGEPGSPASTGRHPVVDLGATGAGAQRASVWQAGPPDEIRVTNLLMTAREVAPLLRRAIRSQSWLDAFLLAAALDQLVEDWQHPDPWSLRRAAAYFRGASARPGSWTLRGAAGLASSAASLMTCLRSAGPHGRALRKHRPALERLVDALASTMMAGSVFQQDDEAIERALTVAQHLGSHVMRLPASFRDFDQHPRDLGWLTRAYCRRRPVADTPLAVVGLRTSGSYLAPLAAACLRSQGFPSVRTVTFRPGRPFDRGELATVRAVAHAGGRILVLDDPPGVGTAYESACLALERAGVPHDSITLLIPLLGEAHDVPGRLGHWEHVVQPWSTWYVHKLLSPDVVAGTLGQLLPPDRRVVGVRLLSRAALTRGHTSAEYLVTLLDEADGSLREESIVVEGAGLGYLGRQAWVVADALEGFVPPVYGFHDGLLFRARLRRDSTELSTNDVVDTILDYIQARRVALPVAHDVSALLSGREPVWEVAAALLSRSYGPLSPFVQRTIFEPLVKRLLAVRNACVVDGDTRLQHWLPDAEGLPRKANFHQWAFSNRDLTCYDPVFDLAGAALPPTTSLVGAQLRAGYRARCGETVDRERWLIYQLAQLQRLGRAGQVTREAVAQRQARVVNEYFAAAFLSDVTQVDEGPLCAVDLDGVLESDVLGFKSTTAAGALALRALMRHGYRPVVATGRSLPELVDRCEVFGLSGGVAEYGSVLYRRSDGKREDLRPELTRAAIDLVRERLRGRPDVRLDDTYLYGLRVQAAGSGGRWGPLSSTLVADLLSPPDCGVALSAIHGEDQTDIIGPGVGKGPGLLALSRYLQEVAPGPPYLLAVGDSEPDLEMFAVSAVARAPRNADPAVQDAGVPLVRQSYQAGFAKACAAVLGHLPGDCPRCRPPALAPTTRALITALSVREAGLRGLMGHTGLLLSRTARVLLMDRDGPSVGDLSGGENAP